MERDLLTIAWSPEAHGQREGYDENGNAYTLFVDNGAACVETFDGHFGCGYGPQAALEDAYN